MTIKGQLRTDCSVRFFSNNTTCIKSFRLIIPPSILSAALSETENNTTINIQPPWKWIFTGCCKPFDDIKIQAENHVRSFPVHIDFLLLNPSLVFLPGQSRSDIKICIFRALISCWFEGPLSV